MTAVEGTQNSQYFFKILNIYKKKINLNQKRNSNVSLKNFGHFGVIH